MRPVGVSLGWGGVRHGTGMPDTKYDVHTLFAVGCGKLLVFIKYIISI